MIRVIPLLLFHYRLLGTVFSDLTAMRVHYRIAIKEGDCRVAQMWCSYAMASCIYTLRCGLGIKLDNIALRIVCIPRKMFNIFDVASI